MALWRCMICLVFAALSLKTLLSHISVAHGRSQEFWVHCGIDGCEQDFRVFNSFFRHIKRTHPVFMKHGVPPSAWRTTPTSRSLGVEKFGVSIFADSSPTTAPATNNDTPPVSMRNETFDAEVVTNNEDARPSTSTTNDTSHDLTRCAAALGLSVREEGHLSQRTVNNIISGVQQYQAVLINVLRKRMRGVFDGHSERSPQLKDEAMSIFDTFVDPFSSSATGQNKTYRKIFNPVSPEEVVVSKRIVWVKRGGARRMSLKNCSFYYVPLIQSLKQLFDNSRIFNMLIRQPARSREGYFNDFCDGALFESHPLFSQRPNSLQILLYTDEIEICNPLGPHASANKLLMFYYTLGNINPKFRSKLAAIRLLAIAKSKDIKQWGVDVVLKRIIEDLTQLYDGLRIETPNGDVDLYGSVVAICGDTLAQHELGGFKEGVGFAYSKCRHCECSFEDMQTIFEEHGFVEKTLENHIRQCNEIENANTETLRSSLKTTYGINRRSRLNDIPAFDLIKQTPQDIMHVVFEGVAPMEIKLVLKRLILSGELDLDHFNSAIQNFPYSPIDIRDKPCPLTLNTLAANDNRLKQSCGQMLILLKMLPFLLDGIRNEYTRFILKLVHIVQIVLAPTISLQTVLRLKDMIKHHLYQFKELFPEANIIPKQHYLLHLPSQITSLGPLIRTMCMRFEAKHQYFKQWASKLNFKNVCKSLANHNQFLESCQMELGVEHPLFANEKQSGPVSTVTNTEYVRYKVRDFLGLEMQSVVKVKWIIMNGNKYMSGKSMIIADVTDSLPVFGLIKHIFLIDSSVTVFEYQRYETIHWDENLLAYKVSVPALAQATEFVSDLLDYTSYFSVSFRESEFVPLKYSLRDVIDQQNQPVI